MKLNNITPIAAMLLFVLIGIGSCTSDQDSTLAAEVAANKDAAVMGKEISFEAKSSSENLETKGLKSVNLGVAGDFVILSKTGITSVYKSSITGDIGTSPITGAAMVVDCTEVTGSVFSVDAAGPACKTTSATMLTSAIGDMQTAYTDAAGRSNPDYLNLGAGTIGGKTLLPGLYKFTSSVNIPTDITISGSSTDVFIFQIAGTLKMSSGVRVTLEGGAQAKNIFWQVAGAVTFGTTSHFEGNILGQTGINMQTGATINGRMLAQTAVTLQMNTVNKPQ
ncbi:MAG: ice-binding protein [Lutibacter sp.]